MSLPDWINVAARDELKLIRDNYPDSEVELLELVIYSPDCTRVWEKSEALTIANSDGQVWLMYAIIKALSAIDEELTESEKWRRTVIEAATTVSNRLRDRPKEKFVSKCEDMATQLDNFIEEFRVEFKTTKFALRPKKSGYANRERFVKQLLLEYIKRGGDIYEADVLQITNTLVGAGLFERKIDMSNVCRMADTVRAKYHELTATHTTTTYTTPE